MCIIEWCNNNQGFTNVILTSCLIYFTYLQFAIVQEQKNDDYFRVRMEHYQKLQNVIGKYRQAVPHEYKTGKYIIINISEDKKEDSLLLLEEVLLQLNFLQTEAKYLFDEKIQSFEQEFYDIAYISKKLFEKKEISGSWNDSIEEKLNIFLEKMRERENFFDKFLNLKNKNKLFKQNIFKYLIVTFIFVFLINAISDCTKFCLCNNYSLNTKPDIKQNIVIISNSDINLHSKTHTGNQKTMNRQTIRGRKNNEFSK